MKKKFCGIFLFFAMSVIFSSDGDFTYFNATGISGANYKGTIASVSAYDLFYECMEEFRERSIFFSEVKKLSKGELDLLWGALDEYDYKPDEVYEVVMGLKSRMIFLFVKIENDMSASWYGILTYL